jgi:hypothetical protein
MYCEHEDFLTHKAEIDGMLSVLASHGISPDGAVVLDLGAEQGMHASFLSVPAVAVSKNLSP